MSRANARIARKLERQLKQQEKTIRMREQPEDHVVRSEYAKEPPKAVRAGANPGSIMQLQMTYTADSADRQGNWEKGTPREWGEETWKNILEPKLAEWTRLNWAEVERFTTSSGHRMHHPMDTDVLADEAQYRLIEIERESDTIYRFRLGNKRRLWGFRILANFEVLWYDPKHEIYPVDPD